MNVTLESAIAAFGLSVKKKAANIGASGEPEEQLRTPLENLLSDLFELCGFDRSHLAAVGESSISDLKTRPDYAITIKDTLVGFIEVKAPNKGADPRKFKDPHDKSQWEKLTSLPNLIYTDGNQFSLWRDGSLLGTIVTLEGDVETAGNKLKAPPELVNLFWTFFNWDPIPPRNAKELAEVTARLCRLLRDEVAEQLSNKNEVFTSMAEDWKKVLFPDASDEKFADGYAQAITFGLLVARARGINLKTSFHNIADDLAHTSSLIGNAIKLLTDTPDQQKAVKTSLRTLKRVLDVVEWPTVSKGKREAWLYFYEDFLEVYDKKLRKKTGSYYTPPEVVSAMIAFVDEVLRSRFGKHDGIASSAVTVADPATGTGTFILGVLRKIAQIVKEDQGEGAVPGAIDAAMQRLIAFEIQLGPFAVAQLRMLAEITNLTGSAPLHDPRMFVTNTLGNPDDDEGWIPGILKQIANSRKAANKIKREEPITVVIGNPPYKEKAKGLGGWIEGQSPQAEKSAPLSDWMPPPEWGVGPHLKHMRNLYIYFWRWATWKVYDKGPGPKTGIICFITAAGFLSGPGFQKMRDYMRRSCDDIWVIDCSPEGLQPEVTSRIFQGVQQPVCIVLASRSEKNHPQTPAKVRFRGLPVGNRKVKFDELNTITLDGPGWTECPADWRAPFLPASQGAWADFPSLEDLFIYNGSGVQPKRTWVISPDSESLVKRWQHLIHAPVDQKEDLFHPTLRNGVPADRHIRSTVREALPGYSPTPTALIKETGLCATPVQYAFRSFNRQWIIPDSRVITQPNAELWASRSQHQIFVTAVSRTSPSNGPAITMTGILPDLDHYNGRGGRVFPLWRDAEASTSNIRPKLLPFLSERYESDMKPGDLLAYIAAVAAHPAFTARFHEDLSTPGLRIPITADAELFVEAVEIGRNVIWLHTFGERMVDPAKGRPAGPPRLPESRRPNIPKGSGISGMPDSIDYCADTKTIGVGTGRIENVEPPVWEYEISGKQVLTQWFSYRKANRERPIIGERRAPSRLCNIQPDYWLSEYTTELMNVLNILGLLVELEPRQADLLERVCSGPMVTTTALDEAGAFEVPIQMKNAPKVSDHPELDFGF